MNVLDINSITFMDELYLSTGDNYFSVTPLINHIIKYKYDLFLFIGNIYNGTGTDYSVLYTDNISPYNIKTTIHIDKNDKYPIIIFTSLEAEDILNLDLCFSGNATSSYINSEVSVASVIENVINCEQVVLGLNSRLFYINDYNNFRHLDFDIRSEYIRIEYDNNGTKYIRVYDNVCYDYGDNLVGLNYYNSKLIKGESKWL